MLFLLTALAWISAAARVWFFQRDERTAHNILEVFLLHTLVLTVGTGALFAFIGRGSRSEQLARRIGWPGQREPAGSLVFAVLGILFAWWRNEFWTATAIRSLRLALRLRCRAGAPAAPRDARRRQRPVLRAHYASRAAGPADRLPLDLSRFFW
jgi:hypothetical protein